MGSSGAVKARQYSNELYRQAVESSADFIYVIDRGFRVRYVNPAGAAALRMSPRKAVGKRLDELFPPDATENLIKGLVRVFGSGKTSSAEMTYHFFQGDLHVHVSLNPIFGDDGQVGSAVVVFRDIGELKMAEETLAKAKDQVELYLDLMGHDINNMNQIAMGYLELAMSVVSKEGGLDPGRLDLLERAVAAVNNSSRLIGYVRKLQRGQSGECRPEIYDLGALIEEVCGQYGSAPDKRVSISCEVARGVRVLANELLRDVFVNLIDNAIKHSGEPVSIHVRMDPEDRGGRGYCRVTIDDDGPGIPDELKDKVFDRLRRGETNAKGSGLGLYLVRSLVESYGGTVWVEDRVKGHSSRGARFTVVLPVQ